MALEKMCRAVDVMSRHLSDPVVGEVSDVDLSTAHDKYFSVCYRRGFPKIMCVTN